MLRPYIRSFRKLTGSKKAGMYACIEASLYVRGKAVADDDGLRPSEVLDALKGLLKESGIRLIGSQFY